MTDKNYSDPTAPSELMQILVKHVNQSVAPLEERDDDVAKAVRAISGALVVTMCLVGEQPLITGVSLKDIRERLVDLEKEAVELAPAIGFLVDID